jgi:hypothetical protein
MEPEYRHLQLVVAEDEVPILTVRLVVLGVEAQVVAVVLLALQAKEILAVPLATLRLVAAAANQTAAHNQTAVMD